MTNQPFGWKSPDQDEFEMALQEWMDSKKRSESEIPMDEFEPIGVLAGE